MSESSLDSELLAVAGRGKVGKKRGRKALSESEEEDVSSEEVSLDDESDWEDMQASSKRRGSTQKPARKRAAPGRGGRAAAKPASSEDDDDGQGEEDESSDEERLEIDEEDLIVDEEDRKKLAAMTELQREFELATRAEKRNQELLRQKLLKKSDAKAEQAGAKAAKRVGRAKSGREEREEAAKKSAMEELKAARERKARGAEERARRREESEEPEDEEEGGEERERGRRDRGREREESESEEGALSSDDGMSDRERHAADRYGRHARPGEEAEDEDEEAPVDDVRKIHVYRQLLEQWVNEPFFEDTLPGAMVKVIAPGPEMPGPDGMPMRRYMLCQVMAVETRAPGVYKDSGVPWKSPYPFGPNNEKTSKWLILERGNSQRGMPLAQVSNSRFTDQEFESWYRQCKESGRPQVSRRVVKDVLGRLDKATSYTYTSADVERLLQEKKAKGAAPRNIALERARLERELEHALEHGDADKTAELEQQIAAMDAAVAESKKRRGRHNMADLNKRNADMNFKNALDNVSNKVMVAGAAGDKAGQDKATQALDPFSRRATRPMIYWSTKRQTGEEADGAQAADGGGSAAADGGGAGGDAQAAEQQQQQQRNLDLDAIVDLRNLDLSLLQRPARIPPLARKLLGATWQPEPPPPGAHVIGLEDYKRRKGWA